MVDIYRGCLKAFLSLTATNKGDDFVVKIKRMAKLDYLFLAFSILIMTVENRLKR